MAEHDEGISWSVATHVHKERTADWYWTLGTLAVLGAGLSVFFGNMLLAVILLVGAGCIGSLVARGPREHLVRLDKRGLSLDGTLYPYRALQSFWVEEERAEPRLFVTTSGLLAPHITVPLHDAPQAQRVREYLKLRVEEEEQWPHLGEHLAEFLGL